MINTDISIYVPVYNGEKTIEKCLDSILYQTLRPNTILVVNDFSNDQTSEILKKYGEKILVHDNPKKALSDKNTVLDLKFLERILIEAKSVNNIQIDLEDKYGKEYIKHES